MATETAQPAQTISEASVKLTTAVSAHEKAKDRYSVAFDALSLAKGALDAAHAAEVEAHNALADVLNKRRKSRR